MVRLSNIIILKIYGLLVVWLAFGCNPLFNTLRHFPLSAQRQLCYYCLLKRIGLQCTSCQYNDVKMGAIASQITSVTIVYPTVYSGADQRKHESSASLAFVRGIHWGPVNSPHKWPVTRKMFPFDDVIMYGSSYFTSKTTRDHFY